MSPELHFGRHAERDEAFTAKPETREDADTGIRAHSIAGKADLEILRDADRDAEVHRRYRARRAERFLETLGFLDASTGDRIEGSSNHPTRQSEVAIGVSEVVVLRGAPAHVSDLRRLGLLHPIRVLRRAFLGFGGRGIGPVGIRLRRAGAAGSAAGGGGGGAAGSGAGAGGGSGLAGAAMGSLQPPDCAVASADQEAINIAPITKKQRRSLDTPPAINQSQRGAKRAPQHPH